MERGEGLRSKGLSYRAQTAHGLHRPRESCLLESVVNTSVQVKHRCLLESQRLVLHHVEHVQEPVVAVCVCVCVCFRMLSNLNNPPRYPCHVTCARTHTIGRKCAHTGGIMRYKNTQPRTKTHGEKGLVRGRTGGGHAGGRVGGNTGEHYSEASLAWFTGSG